MVSISLDLREREKRIRSYIEQHSKTFGIDPNLVRALITQESRFEAKATSPTGAYGYGQMTGIGAKQVQQIAAMSDCPDPVELDIFTKRLADDPDLGIKAICATLWWLFNKKYRIVEDKKVQLEAVLTFYNAGGKPAYMVVSHGGHAQAVETIKELPKKWQSQSLTYAPSVAKWYVAWHELLKPAVVPKPKTQDNPFTVSKPVISKHWALIEALRLLGQQDEDISVMVEAWDGSTEITIVVPGEFPTDGSC